MCIFAPDSMQEQYEVVLHVRIFAGAAGNGGFYRNPLPSVSVGTFFMKFYIAIGARIVGRPPCWRSYLPNLNE